MTTCLGLAVALALLLIAEPAQAGSYSVTYSGGAATLTDGTTSTAGFSYNPNNGTYGHPYLHGSWGTNQDANGNMAMTGGVDCQPTITATFTWNTGYPGSGGSYPGSGGSYPGSGGTVADDPPRAVVIAETCSTSWGAYNTAPATSTGSSDNGLGFAEVRSASGQAGSSQGTRYKIKQNPGASFTITCSPKVVFTGTAAAGPPIASGGGAGAVSYSASAQPLEVVLSGGIGLKDSKRYLIGQRVGASLSTGGLTGDTFSWSVSGGEPFGGYTATQANGDFAATWATTTNPTDFYFKKPVVQPAVATVSCSAHLNVPAGAEPAAGLDVVASRTCSVEKPLAIFDTTMGDVSKSSTGMSLSGRPDPGGNNGNPVGILWICKVKTPEDFTGGGTDVGSWNLVQLVSMSRHRVNKGTAQAHVKNGRQLLDNIYPYAQFSHPADGTEGKVWDSPGEGFTSGLSSDSHQLDSVSTLDSFRTWLMYSPPGGESRDVPIREIKWFWHGAATRTPPADWNLTSLPTDRGWDFEGDLYPPHPEWNAWIDNNELDDYTPPVP